MFAKTYVGENFPHRFLQRIIAFWKASLFCDFTIQVGGKSLMVHSLVLNVASPNWAQTVAAQNSLSDGTGDNNAIKLPPHISSATVNTLLKFLYEGKLELTLDNVLQVSEVAGIFRVLAVKQYCKTFLNEACHERSREIPQQFTVRITKDLKSEEVVWSATHQLRQPTASATNTHSSNAVLPSGITKDQDNTTQVLNTRHASDKLNFTNIVKKERIEETDHNQQLTHQLCQTTAFETVTVKREKDDDHVQSYSVEETSSLSESDKTSEGNLIQESKNVNVQVDQEWQIITNEDEDWKITTNENDDWSAPSKKPLSWHFPSNHDPSWHVPSTEDPNWHVLPSEDNDGNNISELNTDQARDIPDIKPVLLPDGTIKTTSGPELESECAIPPETVYSYDSVSDREESQSNIGSLDIPQDSAVSPASQQPTFQVTQPYLFNDVSQSLRNPLNSSIYTSAGNSWSNQNSGSGTNGEHWLQSIQKKTKFKNNEEIMEHLKKSMKLAICPICNKPFSSNCGLREHMQVQHEGKTYSCRFCGKKLKTKQGHKIHESMHEGKPKYTCEFCSKGFNCSSQYRGHLNKHYGVRPHVCKKCKSAFYHSADLKKHSERCGFKPKPVKCGVCNRKFTNKRHLEEHESAHTDPKRFPCRVCDEAFAYRASLSRHLKSKHPEKQEDLGDTQIDMHIDQGDSGDYEEQVDLQTDIYIDQDDTGEYEGHGDSQTDIYIDQDNTGDYEGHGDSQTDIYIDQDDTGDYEGHDGSKTDIYTDQAGDHENRDYTQTDLHADQGLLKEGNILITPKEEPL